LSGRRVMQVLVLALPRRRQQLVGAVPNVTEAATANLLGVPKLEAVAAADWISAVERKVASSEAAEALTVPALHVVPPLLSLNVRR
jgi:hypothetical protein